MSQPDWEFVDNLGDRDAINHGGLFLYEDKTGEYPAELEKLERDSDADDAIFTIWRVILDRCKEVRDEDSNRVYLVSFEYELTWPHPLPQYEEWFAKDLGRVAETMDTTADKLREQLCSADSKERAKAYCDIYNYHGWENGDGYPLTMNLDEIEGRYSAGEVHKRD